MELATAIAPSPNVGASTNPVTLLIVEAALVLFQTNA
jgi:hypothetical protein